MSASYEITIESVEARTVRSRVLLLNFQYPEAPTNKCFALQILADAHRPGVGHGDGVVALEATNFGVATCPARSRQR